MTVLPIKIPIPRNGAVLVQRKDRLDLRFLAALTGSVQGAATHQGSAGEELDDAEVSVIRGPYDWRAFLKEEFLTARDQALEEAH